MASQGVSQPSSGKPRSFLLRDLFKFCRSFSRALPHNHHHNHHHHHHRRRSHKSKHERKHNTNESKRNDEEHKRNNQFQETVRSRFNNINTDFVVNKKPLSFSRSCNNITTNPTLRSLSFIGRSKSRSTDFDRSMPTLMRSVTNVPRSFVTPILYSSSSTKVVKPPPTEKKLRCTLEELCNGCTKKIKIKRDVITSSGQMCKEEETVEIKVEPGWREGTKVTFEGKGNDSMWNVPADLIFVIVEKEHETFKREGDDLDMTVDISLLEALTGYELSVPLLDGDHMSLKIKDVVYHGYVMVIEGKGMPKLKEEGKKRGDLRVRFRVKFPQQLGDEQRAEIQSILQDCS